jgi:hypothetical protein
MAEVVIPAVHQRRDDKVIYVLRDEIGAPLYVGCTSTLKQRISNLKSTKTWWAEVATIAGYGVDRITAPRVEHLLIRELQPKHNKQGVTETYAQPGDPVAREWTQNRYLLRLIFQAGMAGAFEEGEAA